MDITEQKQTHRRREQISGSQWGEERAKGQDRGRGGRGINYKINKLQGYIVQHRERSQYFMIPLNGV